MPFLKKTETMLHKLSLIFCFFISITAVAQRKYVDVKLITNQDTIQSQMQVITNIFDKTIIQETSFYKKVVLVDGSLKVTQKIKPKVIQKLEFTDFKGETKVYVNDGNQLKRLMLEGKLTWYRSLQYNSYNHVMQYFDYLIDENGKMYKMGLFNHKKNQLLSAIASSEELVKEVEQTKPDDIDLADILKRYNNLP